MPRGKNTKQELMAAAMRLAAKGGVEAATIRAIAQAVGVTEGAIYRHFRTKEELYLSVYMRIIDDMVREKQAILASGKPTREKIRDWVRLTYEYFDRDPEAFAFVLLTPHRFEGSDPEITRQQGRLFKQLVESGVAAGDLRPIDTEVAVSHFAGILLNVTRGITEGRLPGPASQYADEVAESVWRILRRD